MARVCNGEIRIDPSKIAGLRDWPRVLKNKKDIQKTMGILNYLRPVIRGFSKIAKPIMELTKGNRDFEWTKECTEALDSLIKIATSDPVLKCPDPSKPFKLEVDASAFAIGAVLYQEDEKGKAQHCRYYSKALNPTERNYDIWDREFMAVVMALRNWRHLLTGNPHKVIVLTDHANLQYYRHPQKINRRVARYISTLADYNLELKHLPGTKNRADPLSRRPDHNDGSQDNEHVTALPNELFARMMETMALEQQIRQLQSRDNELIEGWKKKFPDIQKRESAWWKKSALIVTEPQNFAKEILERYHDSITVGHRGIWRTYLQIVRDYWWPDLRKFVDAYVKGCATCQQNKAITHRNNPPLNPITPPKEAELFKVIGVDLITKLPQSGGYDSIMTITDQGLTKAVVLIPCKETMGAEELATLYKECAFPYIGLPSKLITDRDVRFTSHMFKELCSQLGVKQNISSAYHPQTDGESECTNQTTETALRIFGNFRQDDWAQWLPLVMYQINSHVSATTKFAPYELWMGYMPRAHQPDRPSTMPGIQERKEKLLEARRQAREAMKRAQELWIKPKSYTPYVKGQKVWLEGKNLRTSHPTAKLRPKRFGPFEITEVLGPTTYRLDLPPTWKIHNAFHRSLLSPYIETTEHGVNFTEPPPEIIEGEPEYEVEKILGSRRHGRKRELQYLVQWKGYSAAHNTWEPKKDVHAPELVNDFYRREPMSIKTLRLRGGESSVPHYDPQPASPTIPLLSTMQSITTTIANTSAVSLTSTVAIEEALRSSPKLPTPAGSPVPTPPPSPPSTTSTDEYRASRALNNKFTPDFQIPTRADHPALDCILTYVVQKKHSDYATLQLLSQCKPANDFTRLCQALCIEGAAQRLSGNIQTIDFNTPDLEELFYDLKWRLCAKSAINTFHETCGLPAPYPPCHEECLKTMRHLNNEWKRRVYQYGVWSTAKFFRKCDECSALYLLLAHNTIFYRVSEWAIGRRIILPSPHESFWSIYLSEDHRYMDDVMSIFERKD